MDRRLLLLSILSSGLASSAHAQADSASSKLIAAARRQKGVTLSYDPTYVRLPYPGGDVPRGAGVCTDVVIRAARDGLGLDLQKLVHEDMGRAFKAYPRTWGLPAPDANIDHRRVPNLETFWRRQGAELWSGGGAAAFPLPLRAGDLITFRLTGNRPHVAIVAPGGGMVHNIGAGVQEEPLDAFADLRPYGHYRWPKPT